jgi:UTP---glucose-1-phosphate uridylyltransferase
VKCGIKMGAGASLPGMIFNLKKQMTYTPALSSTPRTVQAGRMECTMQNLADALSQTFSQRLRPEQASALSTFVVFNERRYVTSSAKRGLVPGSTKIHQTPEGSFLDLMRNARDMLDMCGVVTPPLGTNEAYVKGGCAPAFVWLWHPALGPLWQVVAEKVQGGSLGEGSEVLIEVAELCWQEVHVDGSLQVIAEDIVGHIGGGGEVVFSERCGRARLKDVLVLNAGVDYRAEGNCFWKQAVRRRETCCVLLRGRSEFEARGVTIKGHATFEVPDGFRMTVRFVCISSWCLHLGCAFARVSVNKVRLRWSLLAMRCRTTACTLLVPAP